jgi:hypothetical protein
MLAVTSTAPVEKKKPPPKEVKKPPPKPAPKNSPVKAKKKLVGKTAKAEKKSPSVKIEPLSVDVTKPEDSPNDRRRSSRTLSSSSAPNAKETPKAVKEEEAKGASPTDASLHAKTTSIPTEIEQASPSDRSKMVNGLLWCGPVIIGSQISEQGRSEDTGCHCVDGAATAKSREA